MTVLGIDTSANVASVAVCEIGENPKVIACGSINTKLTHSQTLIPFIESLLANAKLSLDNVDCYAVSAGPGSFTGLRIGVSAIKGMAYASGKPCKAVSTLHGMAYNLESADCVVCAVMDARCNQVYNALFRVENGVVKRICEDRALFIDELKDELSAYSGEKVMLVGDGAELVFNRIGDIGLTLAPPSVRFQNAVGVCFASGEYEDTPVGALMPTYLRLPQAERERLAKLKGKEAQE